MLTILPKLHKLTDDQLHGYMKRLYNSHFLTGKLLCFWFRSLYQRGQEAFLLLFFICPPMWIPLVLIVAFAKKLD
jgi:hypothetical protein